MSLLNTGRSILALFAARVATFAALYITPPLLGLLARNCEVSAPDGAGAWPRSLISARPAHLVTSTVRFDKETEHEDSS